MENKRLNEINERKIEIRSMLQDESKKINFDAVKAELEAINAEEKEIREKQEIAEKINVNKVEVREIKEVDEKMENKEMEYRNAFKNYVAGNGMAKEYRSVTTSNVAIPNVIVNKIVNKLTNQGMILPLVNVTHYEKGSQVPVSSVKPVAEFVAEGATSAAQNSGYEMVTFNGYKLRVKVPVTVEVATMALDDFENVVADNIANAMVLTLEQSVISGTGKGQPAGILTATPAGTVTTKEISYDDIIAMESALPAQYEAGSVYVMSKATFLKFRSVKDSNKRPILDELGYANKELLGRKVIICDYLPSFDKAKANDTVAFIFKMSDYTLNMAMDVTVKEYEDNETDDIVKKAIALVDGKVIDNSSLVVMNKVVTA
jgi:HK97 family phage major capsid protein